MHAVILAGGKGVRLRPYTTALPKPLVPIGERYAILEIVLHQLAAHGFRSVTLAINHLGALIQAFIGDGSRWGLSVEYVEETIPLSTVGPLFGMRDQLPEHFLVMNGDVLTDLNFGHLLHEHLLTGAALTVATATRTTKVDFGVLAVEGGQIVDFNEKPTFAHRVSMGVYGLSRSTLEPYPAGRPFGFDQLVLDLLRRGDRPASGAGLFAPDRYDVVDHRVGVAIGMLETTGGFVRPARTVIHDPSGQVLGQLRQPVSALLGYWLLVGLNRYDVTVGGVRVASIQQAWRWWAREYRVHLTPAAALLDPRLILACALQKIYSLSAY